MGLISESLRKGAVARRNGIKIIDIKWCAEALGEGRKGNGTRGFRPRKRRSRASWRLSLHLGVALARRR